MKSYSEDNDEHHWNELCERLTGFSIGVDCVTHNHISLSRLQRRRS